MDHVVVQFYEKDGEAAVFFDHSRVWNIEAPPHGKLTKSVMTRIMGALRYVPAGRWEPADWGAERKFFIPA
jgi:hypothetical protein